MSQFLISDGAICGEVLKETAKMWTLKRVAISPLHPDDFTWRRTKRPNDILVEGLEEAQTRVAAYNAVIAHYKPALDMLDEQRRFMTWERRQFSQAALTEREPAFAFAPGTAPTKPDPETFMDVVFGGGGAQQDEPQ